MSNLWFNIRFGARHLQMTRDWQVSFTVNGYHIEHPPTKWLEVYCLFGRQMGL